MSQPDTSAIRDLLLDRVRNGGDLSAEGELTAIYLLRSRNQDVAVRATQDSSSQVESAGTVAEVGDEFKKITSG